MMRQQLEPCADPQIAKLVKEILNETDSFDRNLRSAHREPFCNPIAVQFLNGKPAIECFSKNISTSGIALISNEPIEEDSVALLEIHRLTQSWSSEIVAECRWCKPFGLSFWISGWQFVRLPVY